MQDIIYKIKTLDSYRNQFEFCGALIELLYKKTIFKRNSDIAMIISKIYGISFKNYVIRSRTLIVGKLLKEIISSKYEKENAKKWMQEMLILIDYQEKKKAIKKNKSTLNDIQILIKGILK